MPKKKMSPASLENLKKGTPFSADTARIAQEKSVVAKKVYRPLKDIVNECLDEETVRQIMIALKERALSGDVRAWESLRDSAGQKPREEVLLDTDKDLDINIKVIR